MGDRNHQQTDLSLLERLGDSRLRSKAWDEFLARYTRNFFRWFRLWDVDPADIEDLLQETFVKVLGNVKRFERRRDGSFRAWLKTLAHNCLKQLEINAERQLARRTPHPLRARNWGVIQSELARESLLDLFDEWATEELIAMAHSRVRTIVDQDTWDTYRLVVLEKRPVRSLAESMNVPPRKIYSSVFQVRNLMRLELAELDGDPPEDPNPRLETANGTS